MKIKEEVMRKMWTVSLAVVFLSGLLAMAANDATAGVTTPTTGMLFYDAWDIGINQVLHGPFGVLLGVVLVGFGIWEAAHTKIKVALSSALGGILLLSADKFVTGASFIF